MANSKTLTASHLRYLLTMKELDNERGGVRCKDIAAALGLSKPSVHNMMDTFTEMGLISRNLYGIAYFTDAGYAIAEKYSKYYALVSEILEHSFPELDNLQMAACSLLSEISEESLENLCSRKEEAGRSD